MIRELYRRQLEWDETPVFYRKFAGLSTDTKPTEGIGTGSKFYEVDTRLSFQFDEDSGEWREAGVNPGEIEAAVDAWLDAHPEATTTVEDGSISRAKLDNDLKAKTDEVEALWSALNARIAETEEDDADLYLADANGHVVAQFSGGNIQTKHFDSSHIGNLSELETAEKTNIVDAINEVNGKSPANVPKVASTTEDDSLDITDQLGYSLVRFKDGGIRTKRFDSALLPHPIEYRFSGNDLLLAYGYNSAYDAVAVLNAGRANDLFDFSAFRLKPKGTPLREYETSDLLTVWSSGTDMHSPFQFLVTVNADGYYSGATDPSFTGGNHTVEINGSQIKSASSAYVRYFADGKPVSSGYGTCDRFEIRWANNVQAYNCVKADGTGRTSLIEYHDMIFDGIRFTEEIMLMPTEEIKMSLWYGLQTVSWGSAYTSVRFRDGANRGVYTPLDSDIKSGNAETSAIIQAGQEHSLESAVDLTCDLGKRPYYAGDSGAFMSNGAGKSYFTIIRQNVIMPANAGYFLRGSYRFYPTVS